MDENNSLIIEAGADPQGVSYTPDSPEPKVDAKPISSREALEKAASDIEKDGGKIGNDRDEAVKEEPKEPAKTKERQPDGKFQAKAEPVIENNEPSEAKAKEDGEAGQDDQTKERSSEDRDIDKPPARFLPRAKEKWGDVDPDVRGEVTRAMSEMQKGMDEYRESHEFRKELRQFEDMAKQAGTNVRAALENYTNIDKMLRENPVAGVERILQSIGVTPEQYANHVMGQAQQQAANPQSQQTNQLQQQVQALTQQIQQLTQGTQQDRESARMSEVERSIIAPFKAEHPRYAELEPDIAFFLNSDKVPFNLPERQRLEVAYDMAERINPAPSYSNAGQVTPANPSQRSLNPAGAKSIRGAPNGASSPKGATPTSREAIDAAMRQVGF